MILWRVTSRACSMFAGYSDTNLPRVLLSATSNWSRRFLDDHALFSSVNNSYNALITIIPHGTYNSSSWYIFLWDDATPLVHPSSLMIAVCLSLLLTKLLCWTAVFRILHWRLFYTVDLSLLFNTSLDDFSLLTTFLHCRPFTTDCCSAEQSIA
jgi:hypothetical protein